MSGEEPHFAASSGANQPPDLVHLPAEPIHRPALREISRIADDLRLHRHKRIAHIDRDVGLKITPLPEVKLIAFKTVLEAIEKYLNLFFWQFEKTTMMFAMLSAHQIVGKAEIATLKAHAYDLLSQTGTIPKGEWRRLWGEDKTSLVIPAQPRRKPKAATIKVLPQ